MRIGLSLEESTSRDALYRLRDQGQSAADDGFASLWISHVFGVDALTALSFVGAHVDNIEIGSAVVPSYPRHPAVLAQQALTVALATGGRLTLGIGASHRVVIEDVYGYDFGQPIRHMREYLAVLLPLLSGKPVALEGKTLRADIGLSTPRLRRVPVLLAALGPQMLQVAGESADGTVLWMTGPRTIRDHIVPSIATAARNAGRRSPRIVCVLPMCVTSDSATARTRADAVFSVYSQLPSYRRVLDQEGAAGPGKVALIGDEDSVVAQIKELAEAGVTDLIAALHACGDERLRTYELLRSLLHEV